MGVSLRCGLLGHWMRPQSAQPRNVFEGPKSNRPSEQYTLVLTRCERCPKVKVCKLEGHWTMTQLLLGEEMRDPGAGRVRT